MNEEKFKCSVCNREWDTKQQLEICIELHKYFLQLDEMQEKYERLQDLRKNIFGV